MVAHVYAAFSSGVGRRQHRGRPQAGQDHWQTTRCGECGAYPRTSPTQSRELGFPETPRVTISAVKLQLVGRPTFTAQAACLALNRMLALFPVIFSNFVLENIVFFADFVSTFGTKIREHVLRFEEAEKVWSANS